VIPSERRKAEKLLRKEARRSARGERPRLKIVDGQEVVPLAPRERRFPTPKPGENRSLNGFYFEQRPHPSYPMPERRTQEVV